MKKKVFRERYAKEVITNLETYEEPIVKPEPAYSKEENNKHVADVKIEKPKKKKTTTKKGKK